jgi:hypothetical protein
MSSDPLIWHHKWEFVSDDYTGFDVEQSKERSLQWKSKIGTNKDISNRIGRLSYWRKLNLIETKLNISNVIIQTVKEFISEYPRIKNAYDINGGYCDDFAADVIKKMGGYSDNLYELDFYNLAGSYENPPSEQEWPPEFDLKWLTKHEYYLPKGMTVDWLNSLSWSHVFIYYYGKYYDSRCPEGVSSPFELPCVLDAFKRNINKPRGNNNGD